MAFQGIRAKPRHGVTNRLVLLRYGNGCVYSKDCFRCPFRECRVTLTNELRYAGAFYYTDGNRYVKRPEELDG